MDEINVDEMHADEMHVDETARQYTYADYEKIDDDNRYEIIDGVIYLMSAPSIPHQRISYKLSHQLYTFLQGKPCEMLTAPVDVCLNAAGDSDRTVVQPDIIVVCDRSKLDFKRCNGAPDMVVEILSPSTASRDMTIKHEKYMQAGVREYWVVDPDSKSVHVFVLKDGEYEATDYPEGGVVPVRVLDGCEIDLNLVFADA